MRRAPAAIHEPNVPSLGRDATNDSSSATAVDSASANPSTTKSSRISFARGEYRCGERREQSHAADREDDAERGTREREQKILDEQQPSQPHHAGAERRANDQLLLASHAAHEREVHDVRGGDDAARTRRRT